MKKIFLFLLLFPAIFVQAQTQLTCAQARDSALSVSGNNVLYNNGATYYVEGYVTKIQTGWDSGWKNVSFWVADTEDGGQVIEAFRCAAETQSDAPNVGSYVRVTGQLTKYNTTPEFAAGCTCEIFSVTEPPVNLGYKTVADFIALANTKDTCILEGVVTNITSTQYGNFDLVDNTASIFVYGLKQKADGSSFTFSTSGIAEGDTLTISGIYQLYGEKHEVVSARLISHKKLEVPVVPAALRVCAQNLENYYYNYDQSSRPKYNDAAGFQAKTSKIVNSMLTIDADIYAFCEVEAKPIVLAQLADSMNAHAGVADRYAAVSDNIDYEFNDGYDNHLKSGFIYRTDRVETVGANTNASGAQYYRNTMRIQAFKLLANNEALVLSMNHFKAKDSSEDQGESARMTNASHLVNALGNVSTDPDILVLGDLNCEYGEAPITTIINAGFEEQLLRFDASAYSHCYGGGELIDHVLANASMSAQITNAYVSHVCTDECTEGVYWYNSYSDHDPYVIEIVLGQQTTTDVQTTELLPLQQQAKKEIRQGRIVIIRGDQVYTITGQRL